MPEERTPEESDALFARGVWQDDALPGVDLGDGVTAPAVRLDLSPMMLGRVGWAPELGRADARLARPQGDSGPLRLAYLEVLAPGRRHACEQGR